MRAGDPNQFMKLAARACFGAFVIVPVVQVFMMQPPITNDEIGDVIAACGTDGRFPL